MENQIGAWVAIITAIGGIVTGIVGMLIKGRLDYEKLKRETKNTCDHEIQQERAINDIQVRKLEKELDALSGAFALVQSRHSLLPCAYMDLLGVFSSISPAFADAMQPAGIGPDDLIGNDGLGVLSAPVIGPWRLLQAMAVHNGSALGRLRFGDGSEEWWMLIEAMPDHHTLECKLVPVK